MSQCMEWLVIIELKIRYYAERNKLLTTTERVFELFKRKYSTRAET